MLDRNSFCFHLQSLHIGSWSGSSRDKHWAIPKEYNHHCLDQSGLYHLFCCIVYQLHLLQETNRTRAWNRGWNSTATTTTEVVTTLIIRKFLYGRSPFQNVTISKSHDCPIHCLYFQRMNFMVRLGYKRFVFPIATN